MAYIYHFSHCPTDDAADGVGRVPFHVCRGMGVGAEGEACRVVPQDAGKGLHVHAVFQRQRCKCVLPFLSRIRF